MFSAKELRTLSLFLSLISTKSQSSPCPREELLSPCKCEKSEDIRIIRCGESEAIDLTMIFRKLSSNIPKGVKDFDIFYLNNTAIRTLSANVFQNITFKHIFFDGTIQLEYIHQNAFIGTESHVQSVYAWNTNLNSYRVPNENDAFSRLKSLNLLDIWSSDMKCPPEDSLRPCRCEIYAKKIGIQIIAMRDEYAIVCDGDEPYFIRQVFQRMTTKEEFCSLHFDTLSLDNTKWTNLTEIPSDAFADVTFTKISLQICAECNHNKLFIHPLSFGKTALFIQNLEMSSAFSSYSDQLRDTFVAINSLPNLRNVTINSGFTSLRSHTFRHILASGYGQNKLKVIKITGGIIKTIESYPFFVLPNLNTIDLSGNAITRIDKHAFAFRDASPSHMTIDLSNNSLKSSSFESGAFSHSLRPLKLILSSEDSVCPPDFEYLDEDIFAPFLACGDCNVLVVGPCPLQCDSCHMKWLLEVPKHWRKQIIGPNKIRGKILCKNDKSFFDDFRIDDHYPHCKDEDCDKLLASLNQTYDYDDTQHKRIICKRHRNSFK